MVSFKRNGLKRGVSLVLSVLMVLSVLNLTVFADVTSTYGYWTITNADDNSSGTAVMDVDGSDFTYYSPTTQIVEYTTSGSFYGVRSNNTNGAASNGIVTTDSRSYCDYTPATDGTLSLYIGTAANTKTIVVSRTSLSDSTSESICTIIADGSELPLEEETYAAAISGSIITVDVEAEEGYTYYVTVTGSKMTNYGAAFVPYTTLSGTISDSYGLSEYNLRFTNKTTGTATEAEVSGTSYTVVLKPGYDYIASLYGSYATSYAISTATKTVSVTATDDHTQTADLEIEESVSYYAAGSITGLADGYDVSDLGLVFTPSDLTSFEEVSAEIDKTALTYSVQLSANETYTVSLEGAYDYELSQTYTVTNDSGSGVTQDIALTAVSTYPVSGGFLGLTQVRGEYEALSAAPSAITFTNVDDGYVYSGTASAGSYSVSLRDGSYLASITSSDYSTSTHVVVDGSAVSRDLLLKDETAKSVAYSDTLYVGEGRDYESVGSAIEAVSNMTRTDNARVTIKIDPGTYREQLYITSPNITLESNGGTYDDTVITWYYGIGYKYYSCVNSLYDPYADYDQFEKGDVVSYWGSAVITSSAATGFRAENIKFENSFNKYMTDEEIEDGVEVNGLQSITVVRKETTNADTRAATERAAAYVNYADQVEFNQCAFIGSQDTLYTCNRAYDSYYRNCYIEGQTDFIYGNGDVIFDGCEINFCGYDGTEASGYLTAQSASADYPASDGYIFRSCYVSYSSERDVTAGTFGRLWGTHATVAFINTQLQEADMISAKGWTTMGSNDPDTSETAQLVEYNTTCDGEAVDTSGRAAKAQVLDTVDLADYSVESVFIANGWTPYYYVTDSTTAPTFAAAPTLSSNGDLNKPNPGETVTVSYELDQDGDASRISWYGVSEGYDAASLDTILESAALLYTTSAASTTSYQIPTDCSGLYLLVVVTPITNYGLEGEAGYVLVDENPVSDTWTDPDNPSSIAPGTGINIYLAGDSTVKDYSAAGMYNSGVTQSAGSWGEFLQEFFDEDYVTVIDYAQGGRASRSFLNEGKLDTIMASIKEGDYLFMQFGHNDCANGASYYEDRFVPLYTQDSLPTSSDRSSGFPTIKPTEDMQSSDGTYSWDCGATYKGYLQEYIDRALAVGAVPVIVSPVSRLYYSSGKIRTHHDAGTSYALTADYYTTNNAYVTACEELYEENIAAGNNVYYIDGFQLTVDLYEAAYEACGSDEYGYALMDTGDSTHSNKTGGVIQAGLIAKVIQDAGMTISPYVIQPVTVYGEETSGEYIFTIKDTIFTAKDKNLVEYTYWSELGQALFDSLSGSSDDDDDDDDDDSVTGDVDNNGVLTANDSACLLHYVLTGEAKEDWNISDVDESGDIDATDAAKILCKVLNSSYSYTG